MEWDRQVLEYIGDFADYISLHRYVGNRDNDTPDYLAVTNSIDRQIEEMDAACRFVQARRRSKKRAYLCFDEWNVWYKNRRDGRRRQVCAAPDRGGLQPGGCAGRGRLPQQLHPPRRCAEDRQHRPDRQRDRADPDPRRRAADPVDLLPLRDVREAAQTASRLRALVQGPEYEGKTNGRVPYLDVSAILGAGEVHVFASNRLTDSAAPVQVSLADGSIAGLVSAELLTGPSVQAANSYEQPDLVCALAVRGCADRRRSRQLRAARRCRWPR